MQFASLLSLETNVPLNAILLLRHSNDRVARLRRHGATVEEYTAIQPVGSPYDFHHPMKPKISIVAAIVNDLVYGVFRIPDAAQTGTNRSLGSSAYRNFEDDRETKTRICRRFQLQSVVSVSIGLAVRGWEGRRTRTPVQRLGGKFFAAISVDPMDGQDQREIVERAFEEQITVASQDTSEARMERIAHAEKMAHRVAVTSFVFARNADVVAEILARARGICGAYGSSAPFTRRSNGTPYLEIHHTKPLADGGEDSIENAIALCPNCHRKAHYA